MLRWSFLVPRLLIVLALCLWLRFGLDPMLRYVLIRSGQATTGARVDLGQLQSQPLRGRIYVGDLQAAHPRQPGKNLAQCDGAWFDLDARALLRRRFVVSHGVINGLALGGDRSVSGVLPWNPPATDSETTQESDFAQHIKQQFSRKALAWLEEFGAQLQEDLEKEYRSVRLARELSQRWPVEYDHLERRLDDWKTRIDQLRRLANDIRERPLEHVESTPRALSEIESLRQEIAELRREIGRLHRQLASDQSDVREAMHEDYARVREQWKMRELDGQQLSDYLLGDESVQQVETARHWIQQARQVFEYFAAGPQLNHEDGRGTNVSFAGPRQEPDVLLEHLLLTGTSPWRDELLRFRGHARGVTPQPRRYGRPTEIQLVFEGAAQVQLAGTIDHLGPKPTYSFTLSCPDFEQPARRLGDEENLAIQIAPGNTQWWAQFDLVGDDVTGEIRWRQDELSLRPVLGKRLGGPRLEGRLRGALERVDRLHASVAVEGNMLRPDCRLRSNLGPQLASAIGNLAQRELVAVREDLTDRAQAEVDEQLARLGDLAQERQQKLLNSLALSEQQIEAFKKQVTQQLSLPQGLLNESWRVGSLFGR